MRFLLTIIYIGVCAAIAEYFLPWWTIAAVSFILSSAIGLKPGRSFVAGFLGIALFWLTAALCKDIPNQHILSARMAALFHLPGYGLFICITVLLGGIVGGMAAWAGALFRKKSPARSVRY